MPVPSQGHYGFHSFPVVDWFCLFIYLWDLTFPLLDCSDFGNFVITLIKLFRWYIHLQNTLNSFAGIFIYKTHWTLSLVYSSTKHIELFRWYIHLQNILNSFAGIIIYKTHWTLSLVYSSTKHIELFRWCTHLQNTLNSFAGIFIYKTQTSITCPEHATFVFSK
jgi:hypothetical protein